MKLSVILVAVSLGCVSANCTQSFRLSNRTEICEGFDLVLECNTERTKLTVFKGNLLNCSSHEIALLHSRFNSSIGTNGTCNNETVLGQSLPTDVSGNCYTSLLCIMVTQDTVGKIVVCASDDGTAENEIGNYTVPSSMNPTQITPFVATSMKGVENLTSNQMHGTHFNANSLSSTEIIICCSAIGAGIVITVIIVLFSIFGFLIKKNQLQSVQVISSVHISSTDTKQQTSTFHCSQNDEVSNYTLCTTDYDKVVVITDDSEYSHLQHPTGQRAPAMRSRDLL